VDEISKKPVFCSVTQYILVKTELYFIIEISFLYSCICFGASNKEVFYLGKRFKIIHIHIHSSGYCELRKINDPFKVELALLKDITAYSYLTNQNDNL